MARFDRVIRGGMIVDGSRLPRFRGDIGIKDGVVAEIGQIGAGEADEVIDAGGAATCIVLDAAPVGSVTKSCAPSSPPKAQPSANGTSVPWPTTEMSTTTNTTP